MNLIEQAKSINSKSLISLFESNVKLNPNKIAIFHNDQSISYKDLNQRANIIANYLFQLGIKEGDIVAILLERSINLIVAILGILKTGAAYVAIDPDYPISRIEYIFFDTNSDLLLTEMSYEDQPKYKYLLSNHNCQHLYISELLVDNSEVMTNPSIKSNGDTLACVIYTSGTIGKPKGVLLNHIAFFRLFNGSNTVQISSSDCIAQIANASFDAAVYEMWAALGKGGSLVIIDNDIILSPKALEECFKKYNITTTLFTTGLFNQLAKIRPYIFKLLKNVLFGGEIANLEIVHQIISNDEFKPQRLFNLYGPVECGIIATYYEIITLDESIVSVPIGKPINETQVYVLNDKLEQIQPGEIGELYISGEGIARGYLNLPELTEEKFILCPFDLSCKMYKTGDYVKSLSNGMLHFIGRKDNQVKVRGFRIELEEIEFILEKHPDVFQGIVLAPYIAQGHRQLVAYFTAKNPKIKIDVQSVLSHLRKVLPDYMIPYSIVQLDTLPLSAHGKIDRKKLSSMPLVADENNEMCLFSTNAESLLLKIWRDILGIENIQLDDNFFELGGDSVMIMQIIAQAAGYGIFLKHSLILKHPTIQSLAYFIEKKEEISQEEILDSISFPLSAIQNWLFNQEFKNPNYFHQLFHRSLKENINLDYLKKAIQFVIHHHDIFSLRFIKEQNIYKQYYSNNTYPCLMEIIDTQDLLKAEMHNVVKDNKDRLCESIDIIKGPLIKVALFTEGEKALSLMIVVHHLIIDGISWRILMDDILKVYKQLAADNVCSLPAKSSSFKKWVIKTQKYASSKNFCKQVNFWRDIRNSFILPIDFQKGPNIESSNRILYKTLDFNLTQGLLKVVPKSFQVDINEILLTALFQTISEWSGQSEVLLDLEGHGREEVIDSVNVSRTIGWFTGLFPIALKSQAKTLKACLLEIQTLVRKTPMQGIGYGILNFLGNNTKIINLKNDIRFNYLGQFDNDLKDDQLFVSVQEPICPQSDPKNHRTHLLIIECWVIRGQFHFAWNYSENFHHFKTVERLATAFNQVLVSLMQKTKNNNKDMFLVQYEAEELNPLLSVIDKVKAVYPLLPIQEGFLFHAIKDPSSHAYFIQTFWHSNREYNAEAMRAAWEIVIDNNELLRAAYIWEELAHPIQVIHEKTKIPIIEKDWKGFLAEEQEREFNEYLIQDRNLGFDLKKAPLMRLTIIHLSGNEQIMVWSFHHIIMDAWSVGKIIEELDYYYSTLCSGYTLMIKRKSLFRDYIGWQKSQNNDTNKEFWQNYLDGFHTVNQIFFSKKLEFNNLECTCYSQFDYYLSQELSCLLYDYAKRNEITINAVMQGIWAYLLSIYSNSKDVVFGFTVSTRSAENKKVNDIVGPMLNTIPFRVIIDDNLLLLEYLKKIQSNLINVIDHSYYSHINIQRESQILSGNAHYYSSFGFESRQLQDIEDKLFFFYKIKIQEVTHYPLSLYIIPGEIIHFDISFNTDWYYRSDINELIDNYVNLLLNIEKNKDISLKLFSENIRLISIQKENEERLPCIKRNRQSNHFVDDFQCNLRSEKLHDIDLTNKIASIWSEVLQKKIFEFNDNFFDIGGDSLLAIRLVAQLNKVLQKKLNIRTIYEAPTIAKQCKYILENPYSSRFQKL